MKKLYWFIKKFIILIPLVLGIIGYIDLYPGEYTTALYFALRLYGLNYDASAVTPILEIARWMAPLVLITTVVLTIQSLAIRFHNTIHFHLYHPMMIYGNNLLCDMFCEDLKNHKIKYLQAKRVLPSKTHVIMLENDQENLRFFAKNIELLKGDGKIKSSVYIQLEDFNDHMFNHEGIDVYPFSISYAIAQLYWRSQCKDLCNLVYLNKPIHIAIIGDGIYAKKLLEEGLLFNIYGLKQEIIYHLYGEWKEFKATHLYWEDIEKATNTNMLDKVIFHEEDWYLHLQELEEYQKIIVAQDELSSNLHITHQLKAQLAKVDDIDVLLFDHDMFSQHTSTFNHIQLFGDYHDACTYEIIIQEQLVINAKKQHQNYSNNEKKKDKDYKIIDWYDLSNFIRNSNITSSNFTMHNLPQIRQYLTDADEMACLEHIRWSRYHFMNNWHLGSRDNQARRHPDLIPYSDLSKEDKEKDYQAKGLKEQK